jgi:hypothetical protein
VKSIGSRGVLLNWKLRRQNVSSSRDKATVQKMLGDWAGTPGLGLGLGLVFQTANRWVRVRDKATVQKMLGDWAGTPFSLSHIDTHTLSLSPSLFLLLGNWAGTFTTDWLICSLTYSITESPTHSPTNLNHRLTPLPSLLHLH